RPGKTRGAGRRDRQARRLRHFPRRRQHHPMGLRAARGTSGVNPDEIAALVPEFRGRIVFAAPLAPYTWFRVGGPADALVSPADEADLAYLIGVLPVEIPVTVI